jgi:hypothetical protein
VEYEQTHLEARWCTYYVHMLKGRKRWVVNCHWIKECLNQKKSEVSLIFVLLSIHWAIIDFVPIGLAYSNFFQGAFSFDWVIVPKNL